MSAGFYHFNGEALDYGPTTVWLPSGQVLCASNVPTEPVDGWQWFDDYQSACEAHGLSWQERARDEQGRFIADDPSTPDVDEAWVEVQP